MEEVPDPRKGDERPDDVDGADDGDDDGDAFVDTSELGAALEPEPIAEGDDDDDGGYDNDDGAAVEDAAAEDPNKMVELADDSVQGFFDHTDSVFAVSINPRDANIVVTGGADDRAFLWDLRTGDRIAELTGHGDSVADVAFNFDGSLVATSGLDGKVLIWSSSDGKLLQTLEGPSQGVSWVQWHPRGNAILAGSEDCSAWLWLAPQNKTIAVFMGHTGSVECGAMTADGKLCVTGSTDMSLRIWKPKDGTCAHVIDGFAFHQAPIVSLALHPVPGNPAILSGDETGGMFLSNLEGHRIGPLLGHTDSVEAVCLSSTLPLAASGSMDGTLRTWDLNTLSVRQTVKVVGDDGGLNQLLWHPSQPLLLGSTTEGKVRLWDARSLEVVREWSGPTSTVNDLGVSSDWTRFVTAEDGGQALVFDIVLKK